MSNEIRIILLSLIFGAIICSVGLIFSPQSKNRNYERHIPFLKRHSKINGELQEIIHNYLVDITIANGMENDSYKALMIEIKKMIVFSGIAIVAGVFMNYLVIALPIAVFLVIYPILRRHLDKKSFKKAYISEFYIFLDYIILYTSGGVPMQKALIETEKIIPENSVIKPRLKQAVIQNAIAGISGDTYIEALKILNDKLNFPEINTFIFTTQRSFKVGVPIADILTSQLEEIQMKTDSIKKEHIAAQESKFEIVKVAFCMLPTLILFAAPMFVSAILQLSGI